MEIIEQKRKIYDHIDKSFGKKLKIKTLRDLINVESFPKADREIISTILKTNLIVGDDDTRIEKSDLLNTIKDLTQCFIIADESQYRDYGIDSIHIGSGGRRYVKTLLAILPASMVDKIYRKTGSHYEVKNLGKSEIKIDVEKENGVNKIYIKHGDSKKIIGVTDNNISKEQFSRGGIFENAFKAMPICHIRYVEKEDKIYLVETQSDLIQRKARLESEVIPTIELQAGTMMELNKLYFEETLKIDTFDIAIGLLNLKFPGKQILTTSGATQSLIEGWRGTKKEIQKFDNVKQILTENISLHSTIARSTSNKYELFEMPSSTGIVETYNIKNENERIELKKRAARKMLELGTLPSWHRVDCKVLYNYDMDKIMLVKKEYLKKLSKTTVPESVHPEIKRIEDRKKRYKLKTVYEKTLSEPWYTSDTIQQKQEYIYSIAA